MDSIRNSCDVLITIHFRISSLWLVGHLTLPHLLPGDKVPPHVKVEHIAGDQLFMLLQVVDCLSEGGATMQSWVVSLRCHGDIFQ